MKKVLVLLLLLLNLAQTKAQFKGSIEFKNYTPRDTGSNVYVVRGDVVKLNQYLKRTNTIEGSYIFDLKTNTIRFVHTKRKVWGEHKSETVPVIRGVCEVITGKNTKVICGEKCKEYIVKNNEENTIITYWISDGKYNFFMPMLKLWNRKDKQSIYFHQIKDLPTGSMPLLSEEKLISDGRMVTRLEVTKITKKTPVDAELDVPAGYSKIE